MLFRSTGTACSIRLAGNGIRIPRRHRSWAKVSTGLGFPGSNSRVRGTRAKPRTGWAARSIPATPPCGDLTEWYVNRSQGVEQGFTLAHRPGTDHENEPLVISLGVTGEVTPAQKADEGSVLFASSDCVVLRYSGLTETAGLGRSNQISVARKLQQGWRCGV